MTDEVHRYGNKNMRVVRVRKVLHQVQRQDGRAAVHTAKFSIWLPTQHPRQLSEAALRK